MPSGPAQPMSTKDMAQSGPGFGKPTNFGFGFGFGGRPREEDDDTVSDAFKKVKAKVITPCTAEDLEALLSSLAISSADKLLETKVVVPHTAASDDGAVNDPSAKQTVPSRTFTPLHHEVDKQGRTLLHHAACSGNVGAIKKLLQLGSRRGVSTSLATGASNSPLFGALTSCRKEALNVLLEDVQDNTELDLDARYEPLGKSLLHVAASNNFSSFLREFLQRGADPNIQNDAGHTPLHSAARGGSVRVIAILAEFGANPNVTANEDGNTALHESSFTEYYEVVDAMATAFAAPTTCHRLDVEVRNNKGETPLYTSCDNGHVRTVQSIIAAGANVRAGGNGPHKRTALHLAAERGYVAICQHLVEAGADTKAVDDDGKIPYDLVFDARRDDLQFLR